MKDITKQCMHSTFHKYVYWIVYICFVVVVSSGLNASMLTTHLLSIERADWSKQLDVFKARDAKIWQREFPVGFPV